MRPKIEITDEMVRKLKNVVHSPNRDHPWSDRYYRGALESILNGERRKGDRRAGEKTYVLEEWERASDRNASTGTGHANTQAQQDTARMSAPTVSEDMAFLGWKAHAAAMSDMPALRMSKDVDRHIYGRIFKAMYLQMLKEKAGAL